MFGYHAGTTQQALGRMTAERAIARERWPFLTSIDLSGINAEQQLVSMVKHGTGKSLAGARSDVGEWIVGYRSRVSRSANSETAQSSWHNEGGSQAPEVRKQAQS